MPFISFIGFCIGGVFSYSLLNSIFPTSFFSVFCSTFKNQTLLNFLWISRTNAKLVVRPSLHFNSIFCFNKRHRWKIQENPPECCFLCFRSAFRLRCVQSLCDRCGFPTLADQPIGSLLTSCFGSSRTKKQSLLQMLRFQEKDKTNLSHAGLNPAHVRFWMMNNHTFSVFCGRTLSRADIEGSKCNVALGAWLQQASYPCGNFSVTSRKSKFRIF